MHYKQLGGALTSPINILRTGNVLIIYSINYFLHKNSYNFYNAKEAIKKFISAVEEKFVPSDKIKVQGSINIINYQLLWMATLSKKVGRLG